MLEGPHYGPKSGNAPRLLMVLCHGRGADGIDLIDLALHWSTVLPDAKFIAPNAPHPCDGSGFGREWFDISDRSRAHLQAGVEVAAQELNQFIDTHLAELGLPPWQVALMGFSQGAMTALHAAARRSVSPRAVISFSGGLLQPDLPPRNGWPPILMVHGQDDTVVPPGATKAAVRSLENAGAYVESLLQPGLAHKFDADAVDHASRFLQRWASQDV